MSMQITSMEEAVRVYRKVEASLESKAQVYEAATAKEKAALKQLEVIMRAMLNQAGVQSMNLPGMAEVKIVPKRVFGNSDWDMFMHWLVVNDCPELLQKRIHEGNMQQWIDEHPGAELPPGVNVFTEHNLKLLKGK